MTKVAIIQSNFMPWKGYFDIISSVDYFVFFDTCQYTRRDWRNRNKIKVVNGDSWISVPVQVKNKFDQKINETLVSDSNWAQKIWNKVEYNYKNAPFYSYVKENLYENVMKKIDSPFLSVINQTLIEIIAKEFLHISTEFRKAEDFNIVDDKNMRLINIVKELEGTEYISGEAAKSYIQNDLFDSNNIKLTYMEYNGYEEYEQLSGEFDHFVSIIDLLMMKGPDAKNYLLNK